MKYKDSSEFYAAIDEIQAKVKSQYSIDLRYQEGYGYDRFYANLDKNGNPCSYFDRRKRTYKAVKGARSKSIEGIEAELKKWLENLVVKRKRAIELEQEAISSEKKEQEEYEARKAESREDWVGCLRVAFGGDPDAPLPEDKRAKNFENKQLLDLDPNYNSEALAIKLPKNQAKGAQMLAELDELISKYK